MKNFIIKNNTNEVIAIKNNLKSVKEYAVDHFYKQLKNELIYLEESKIKSNTYNLVFKYTDFIKDSYTCYKVEEVETIL